MTLIEMVAVACMLGQPTALASPETETVYLSGPDKDRTVDWEFFCTEGRNSGNWTTLPVPSHWEFHGFGGYDYGRGSIKADEQGKYRYPFQVPTGWSGKEISIVFEGVMTDTQVWINGQSAGPEHQGGFYRFGYDITDKLKLDGPNLLEVTVSKVSANESIELAERRADYWVFGGIYRPVYLEAAPREHIRRTAVDARADGTLRVDVFLSNIERADVLQGQILDAQGNPVGAPVTGRLTKGRQRLTLHTSVTRPKTWTAETPNLYRLKLDLKRSGQLVHSLSQRFGFRTIELRPGDGIYLNGTKIRLKGINRHSFWPDSGRCLSEAISREDILLIKSMNMNAVRMSHYPPDAHFLELCDELGLYVIDELCTWQTPSYETPVARRIVKQIVARDVNHPCILFWANGNEGGWNREVDGDFALHDPQARTVLHPHELFGDVDTDHYESYESAREKLSSGNLFMPTELLHGLYDGGHGAGLDDYWKLMRRSPLAAGIFLWVLSDEGAVRTDQGGRIDAQGNQAPDGIVGPYREKEGSFYTVREIWSPVRIDLPAIGDTFSGEIEVSNDYDFLNLDRCRYRWQWVAFPGPGEPATGDNVLAAGEAAGPSVGPEQRGTIRVGLPADWPAADALRLTFYDPAGRSIRTWTWGLKTPKDYRSKWAKLTGHRIDLAESPDRWVVTAGPVTYTFGRRHGQLIEVQKAGRKISFAGGPRLVSVSGKETRDMMPPAPEIRFDRRQRRIEILSQGSSDFERMQWTVHPGGLLELNYRYRLTGKFDCFGISFDYPESNVLGVQWLGQGPYRVWKNRMRGTQLGVWQNTYNDTTPGESWDYPEFKGHFAGLHWARLQTSEGPITVYTDSERLFLRMFTPKFGEDPRNAAAEFPPGDVSFLHAIAPIGTKFLRADELGPQGQPTEAEGIYEGRLVFQF